LTEEHAETFSLWGIRSLGMLADLPEKELIARMSLISCSG
jgi:protein ImuB